MSQSSGSIDIFIKFRAKDDNPDEDVIPSAIPTTGAANPGSEFIPAHSPGDKSDNFIPSELMTIPASGSADRPRYSEHPA
eukprot:878973-Heterocapsa_arctica.AAC.1